MEQPSLTTPRLVLRPVEKRDQQKVFEGFSHPEVTKHFDITYATLEATDAQMEWYKNNRENGLGYAWVVANEQHDFMGVFSIYRIDHTNKRCELGYWLLPVYWGKGYASESIPAILKFVANNLKLHRIAAEIEPENSDSTKLLAGLGFEREAFLRDYEFRNGKYNNLEIWAMLFPNN
ncbi:MAG: GNAT family N-acetyltransferase [Bacteroidota bacterium]